jgi:hypothetical protein
MEFELYRADREAWLKDAVRRMAERIPLLDDSSLRRTWAMMSRDYQLAVWSLLGPESRIRVRRARGGAGPP